MTPAQSDAARFAQQELRRLRARYLESQSILNGLADVLRLCEVPAPMLERAPAVLALGDYGEALDAMHSKACELVRLADGQQAALLVPVPA
jgi:hypothetical protein